MLDVRNLGRRPGTLRELRRTVTDHERLGLDPGQEGIPSFLWLDAESVVREGLRDAARGRPVSIPSLRYKLLIGAMRALPGPLSARLAKTGR